MKNKRKIIIIVVCVLVAAAIAVCAGVGYHYSRPERTAEKVLTAVFTADEAEIRKRREAIDSRTFDAYIRELCDGAVTDSCIEGMIATNPLYYNTVVFEEGAALKEQSGHVVVKKENGKWCVSGFSVKSNEKAE